MKKIYLLLFLLLLPLTGCHFQTESAIMIITDTHFLADSLTAKEGPFVPENMGRDGRIQDKDDQIIDTIIETANKRKPKLLLITGDLTYNGEKESHKELANKLKQINQRTKVLVIPGNHDILSVDTYSYTGESITKTDKIDEKQFKEIYQDYGYNNAYSYDEKSLSYIYKFNDKQWILMLDTAMYYDNDYNGFNTLGGYIQNETIMWLEEHLQYAQSKGIRVISAMHHNLSLHSPMFTYGYRLYNYQTILELYARYNVKLNFSGHLHIQSILSENINEKTIYDIATNGAIVYGNNYSWLEISKDQYIYQASSLFENDPETLSFSKQRFIDRYKISLSSRLESFNDDEKEKLMQIIGERNAEYFAGRLSLLEPLSSEDEVLLTRFKSTIEDYENSYFYTYLDQGYNQDNLNLTINF